MIETVTAVAVLVGGAYTAWTRVVRPRTVRYRLRRLYQLVEAWYDEVDTSLEAGFNEARAANLEAKVSAFIRDHGLEDHKLSVTPRFRRRFLQMCGIKRELRDDWDLFVRYSRCSVGGMPLGLWWQGVIGAFYRFHADYVAQRPDANWANVTMQLKFLKMYSGAKVEG